MSFFSREVHVILEMTIHFHSNFHAHWQASRSLIISFFANLFSIAWNGSHRCSSINCNLFFFFLSLNQTLTKLIDDKILNKRFVKINEYGDFVLVLRAMEIYNHGWFTLYSYIYFVLIEDCDLWPNITFIYNKFQ